MKQNRNFIMNKQFLALLSLLSVVADLTTVSGLECPERCSCTNEINCASSGLDAIPQFMTANAESLDLHNNTLREVKRDQLEIFHTIQVLNLASNQLERIDDNAFSGNNALIKLNLADNQLVGLYQPAFQGLDRLMSLNLTHNQIQEVFSALSALPKLRELYLGFNRIEEIPKDAFAANQHLRILDCRNNEIRAIHPEVLRSMSHLRFLVLSNNPLRQSGSQLDIRHNHWLHVLDMTNCQISSEMQPLPKRVRDVRLSNNNLTSINTMFLNASYIDMIILNNNSLHAIDENALKNLRYLRELWLNGNRLQNVPTLPRNVRALHADDNEINVVDHSSFSITPFVEIVSLQNNKITRLPSESFRNLQIRMIDVSMNEIAILQRFTFSNLPVLYSLDLSKNPIQRLDVNSFDNVTNLHWLQMARTSSSIEVDSLDMLHTMTNLQYLDLSSSPGMARKLIESGVVLNEVRTLNLMQNDLLTLPSTFPEQIPNIKLLYLSGNKWHCNASLAWFPEYIRTNDKLFFSKHHIVCYTPVELRSKAIYEIDEAKMKDILGPPAFDEVEPCPECKEPCEDEKEPLTPEGTEAPKNPETELEGGEGTLGPEPANLRVEQADAPAVEVHEALTESSTVSMTTKKAPEEVTVKNNQLETTIKPEHVKPIKSAHKILEKSEMVTPKPRRHRKLSRKTLEKNKFARKGIVTTVHTPVVKTTQLSKEEQAAKDNEVWAMMSKLFRF